MPAAGGSATINGILFQLLGTLGHAAEVWMRPQVWRKQDLQSVLLTVEPVGGGGDLQLATGSRRVVEQWKVRSGSRTWSLREVIEEVIPDLYLAVDEDIDAYRFRTNGRMGSWSAAYTFFQNLGKPPDKPSPALLDDTAQCHFARGVWLSKRQLFQWVIEAVRSRREVAQEPIPQTHRKVWHLLSQFEMPTPVALPELVALIEKALKPHVNHIEDIEAKRHELCTRIAALAAQGEVRLTPEDVLKEAGLSKTSFLRWNDVRQRLQERLKQRIKQAGYRSALDVRQLRQGLLDYSVIIFASGSGQGKTWQLASFARAAANEPGLVVWVPSARRSEPADAVGADEIWKRGLGHNQRLDLEDVVDRRANTNPNAPVPWATICIDDVRTPEEADYLTTLEWKRWGMTHQQLEAFLVSLKKSDDPTLRRLVYLPMDLLWLSLNSHTIPVSRQMVLRILGVLDQQNGYGVEAEYFYGEAAQSGEISSAWRASCTRRRPWVSNAW